MFLRNFFLFKNLFPAIYDSDSEEEKKRLVNGHGGSWGLKKVESLYKLASPLPSSSFAGPLDASHSTSSVRTRPNTRSSQLKAQHALNRMSWK